MPALVVVLGTGEAAGAASEGPASEPRAGARDPVLARVGASRRVTAGDFMAAFGRASLPLDSLTPGPARRFLDLLVDREVLAERARAEPRAWSPAESAGVAALRDRLVLAAALDSALAAARDRLRAAGDSAADAQTLGVAARDQAIAALDVAWDEPLLERLAAAFAALPRPTPDSTLAGQLRSLQALPRVAPADSAAVVARSRAGSVTVRELLDSWQRLGVAYRPRIDHAGQVRDLVRNGLFEKALRAAAARPGAPLPAAVAEAVAQAAEEISIRRLLEQEVVAGIVPDPRAIERFHRARRRDWETPARVRLLRLSASSRAEGSRLALRLRDPALADSLAARARRAGLEYVAEVTAAEDSAAFHAATAAGPGAVLGPDEQGGAWQVTRVVALVPARIPPLEEVRPRVERAWLAAEAERRTRALCDRLRAASGVRVDEDAWSGFARSLPGPNAAR